MEIALSGIILFIILLPGISFCRGYYYGEFSNQYTTSDFYNLLINTIFPSILLYIVALPLIHFFSYSYDFKTLFGIISSNDGLVKASIENIEQFKTQIILFQLTINLISFALGRGLYVLVLKQSFDTRIAMLRYKNIWHYLITARFFNFEKNSDTLKVDTVDDIDLTYIDALVNINDETFIYRGVLMDYQLGKDGTLDLIIISEAQRKILSQNQSQSTNNPQTTNQYKDIKGNYLILKYSDLINLNLSFIQINTTYDANGNVVSVQPHIIS